MLYKPVEVDVPEKIHDKLKVAITQDRPVSVQVKLDGADTNSWANCADGTSANDWKEEHDCSTES